ncbi:MAG: rod shape-determining protein RodA [Planctomycetes bacterium]|nr:rod shape-determining protein RodA [Planctomycetota bacterium]
MTTAAGAGKVGRWRLVLFASSLALTALGILFVHSTTAYGDPFPSRGARGQILKAAVALAGLLVAARLDYRHLDRWAYAIFWTVAAVLAGMLAVKLASGGRNRFIHLYLFQVQPSELMKIGLILALARYLRFREDQKRVAGLVGPFSLTLGPMILVLLQPNLGLSLMFPPVLVAMLFVSGSRPRHLATAAVAGVTLLAAAYLASDRLPLLQRYQRDRLQSFVARGSASSRNQGFQLRQSLIAVGSGGPLGKGYGRGTQNTLDYLPEKETDFIFSIVAEETGFAGAGALVLLYGVLVTSILRIGLYTREPFGRLVAAGIGVSFAAQAFENIGMTLGLTPITGIALPFVSLAGSNLVASHLAVGIVLSIGARRVRVVAPKDLDPPAAARVHRLLDDRPAALLEARWPTE